MTKMVFFGHFAKKSNNDDVTVINSETKLTNSKIFKPYYFKPYFKYYNNTFKPKKDFQQPLRTTNKEIHG